jgi:hypothetical protein
LITDDREGRRIRTVVVGFLSFAFGAVSNASAQATHDACVVYRQLDRQCHCAGADHYFLSYGEKYCERFMRTSGWSPAGVRWRDRTMACLARELRTHVGQRRHGCDCATIKSFAFESHARCYTQQPFSACKLPLADLALIYRAIDLGAARSGRFAPNLRHNAFLRLAEWQCTGAA